MSRIAIIGGGRAATLHAEAALATPGVELVGVGGRSPGTAGPLAAALGVPDLELDRLVEAADGVVLAVPPRAVAGVLTRIAPSCAVLIESPVGLHATRRRNAMTAVNLLHADTVKRALRAIEELGHVHHLVLRSRSARPTWGCHGSPAFGGGVLLDPAAGVLPVLLAAAGVAVESVAATIELGDHAQGGVLDLAADLAITFEDGRRARADLAWGDGPPETELEAAGSTGVVSLRLWPRPGLEIDGRPVAGAAEPPLVALGFVEQMRRFAALAAGRGEAWPPLGVGDGVIALAEAATSSALAQGSPVRPGASAVRYPADVLAAGPPG